MKIGQSNLYGPKSSKILRTIPASEFWQKVKSKNTEHHDVFFLLIKNNLRTKLRRKFRTINFQAYWAEDICCEMVSGSSEVKKNGWIWI